MALNKELINDIITVTSKAAISCYDFIGKNQKKNADKSATDSMRNEINKLPINGEVVIGEGELDKAPMLYIGEKLGLGGNLDLDIAVDPVEGTNFVAKKLPGALSNSPSPITTSPLIGSLLISFLMESVAALSAFFF